MTRSEDGRQSTVGFQRAQSDRSPPRTPRSASTAAVHDSMRSTGEGQTVMRLKSGILVTAPPKSEAKAAAPLPPIRRGPRPGFKENSYDRSNSEQKPPKPRSQRRSNHRRFSSDYPPGYKGNKTESSASESDTVKGLTNKLQAARKNGASLQEEFELAKKLEDMKACESTQRWLSNLTLNHLQLEKEKADEQNRQMQLQTQALMDERAKIKAEKEALERKHNEMAAKIELLEGLYQQSDADYHGEDDSNGSEEFYEHQERQNWADVDVPVH